LGADRFAPINSELTTSKQSTVAIDGKGGIYTRRRIPPTRAADITDLEKVLLNKAILASDQDPINGKRRRWRKPIVGLCSGLHRCALIAKASRKVATRSFPAAASA
jgi:hypothetical protein